MREMRERLPFRPAGLLVPAFAAFSLVSCVRAAPPPSSPPSADAALGRMRASLECGHAIQASAKVDHFGEGGRVRGDVLLFAARPARIRMDVVSPFGAALATLTTDGVRFSMADLKDRRFFVGPATACNIARLTTVPVPGHVLVDLLRGQAPVLKHDPRDSTMAWSPNGYWILTLPGQNMAREEIHLAPVPADWARPWQDQRLRVLDVRVEQQGYLLYHAELDDHEPASTAAPREDPDNLEAPLPPSGPACHAEVPRRIHIELDTPPSDLRIVYQQLSWNPPLPSGTFEQSSPPGFSPEEVTCP
jgi:hypothetical protein